MRPAWGGNPEDRFCRIKAQYILDKTIDMQESYFFQQNLWTFKCRSFNFILWHIYCFHPDHIWANTDWLPTRVDALLSIKQSINFSIFSVIPPFHLSMFILVRHFYSKINTVTDMNFDLHTEQHLGSAVNKNYNSSFSIFWVIPLFAQTFFFIVS